MFYIVTRNDFGHNTFYIVDHMKEFLGLEAKRLKYEMVSGTHFTPNDWVVRWGLAVKLPNGPKVINRRSAILETSEKGVFRNKVATQGLSMKTWLNLEDFLVDLIDGFKPVVVRPLHHQRSEDIVLAETPKDVIKAYRDFDSKTGGAYISEFFDKTKEFRVFVANGRAMIVAEKKPKTKGEVSWGCVEDGELDYVYWTDWPKEVVECAIRSFYISSLNFAAIDILWKDGQAYFLEANTAPEVWAYYGKCFAKVYRYMMDGDKRENLPLPDFTSWKNTIHPAILGD